MARPKTYPEQIQFMAREGATYDVEARKKPGETRPDLWRRMLEEWLATTPVIARKGERLSA
jgi:hypothetical protein